MNASGCVHCCCCVCCVCIAHVVCYFLYFFGLDVVVAIVCKQQPQRYLGVHSLLYCYVCMYVVIYIQYCNVCGEENEWEERG